MEENNNKENKIIEDAKEMVKDEAKKTTKNLLKQLIPILGWILLILIIMGVINLIVYEIVAIWTGERITSSANDPSTDKVVPIVTVNPDGGYQLDGSRTSGTTKVLGEINIDNIDVKPVTANSNHMTDKYTKVELQTILPETGQPGDFDGLIKIQKLSADSGEVKQLTYKKYDDFCEMSDSNKLNYFSLNPTTFKLCLATKEYTIYKGADGQEITDMNTSSIVQHEIEYLSTIQNYSIPYNFLSELDSYVSDEKFMDDVINMMLGDAKSIVLTYVESSIIETTKKDYSGEQTITTTTTVATDAPGTQDYSNTEAAYEPTVETITLNNSNIKDYEADYENLKIDYYEKIKTTHTGLLHVTSADTCLKKIEKKIEPKSVPETDFQEISKIVLVNKVGEKLPAEVYTTTDSESSNTITTTIEKELDVYIEETTFTQAISNAYTVVDTVSESRIDDFVEMIEKSYPNVKEALIPAPKTFFNTLQYNENTQQLEQVMKDVIKKLSSTDYGVKEEDLEYLLNDEFIEYTGLSDLSSYLRQFSNSNKEQQLLEEKYYNDVKNATDGLNLSKQQIFGLVAIDYNFDGLSVRNGKTFKQTYEAGLELYEEGSLEHNTYTWDNWWSLLGDGNTDYNSIRDAAFETYANGIFDFSQTQKGEGDIFE